jgi:hypothetical protein
VARIAPVDGVVHPPNRSRSTVTPRKAALSGAFRLARAGRRSLGHAQNDSSSGAIGSASVGEIAATGVSLGALSSGTHDVIQSRSCI